MSEITERLMLIRTSLGFDRYEDFAQRYMISGRWLLLGDGAMWDKAKVSQNEDMQSLIATAKSIMQQVSKLENG